MPYFVATDLTTYLRGVSSCVCAVVGWGDVLEEAGAIRHLMGLAKLEGGFKDTRPAFCVPSLDVALERLACVEDVVEVFLVVDGARQAVAKHALGQGRQGTRRIVAQVDRGGRLGIGGGAGWCFELKELVLGCVGHC